LNGVPRFAIDVKRFGGTPTLTLKPTLPHGATITLKNARFPGTELSADFVLVLAQTGPLGTPAKLTFTLGGFDAQVVIEYWLAGHQVMQSSVTLSGDVCPLGAASKLAVSGPAHARFLPNWLMQFGGTSLATISGLGPAITSDGLTLKLLLPAVEHQPPSEVETHLARHGGRRAAMEPHTRGDGARHRRPDGRARRLQHHRDRSRRRPDRRHGA
jgi:hypothetical protein